MDAVTESRVLVSSYGGGSFSLQNLRPEEVDLLQASLQAGSQWVRVGPNGRLEHSPFSETPPSPIPDVDMEPFWSASHSDEPPIQYELFSHTEMNGYSMHSCASITIQHLCGYGYTPEAYAHYASELESFGFECLRSRRGTTGQYWELWFLPGVWRAKGRLRDAIVDSKYKNDKLKTRVTVEFLRRNVQFGTLDVSVQRLAQVLE